jgi:hypothetical protein
MHPLTISLIMKSPMAKFELEKLQAVSDESVINVPLRVEKAREIRKAGELALQHNSDIMSDPTVDVKVRSRVAQHFLDRAVFDVPTERSQDVSFRDLLKSMSAIENQLTAKTIDISPGAGDEERARRSPTPLENNNGHERSEPDVEIHACELDDGNGCRSSPS